MKVLIKACIIVAVLMSCVALPAFGDGEQLRFHVRGGEIVATLYAYQKTNTSSVFLDMGNNFVPTASEEANVLRQVMQRMSSLDYDPAHLVMISLSLRNSKYRAGVENSVAKSQVWRSCIGYKHCYWAAGIANQYLRAVDAYQTLDKVLHLYGLKRKMSTVDNMWAGQVDGRVVCDGIIRIELEQDPKPDAN